MVNHGLASKLATDLLLLRSLGRLFSYRKFTSSLSADIRALCFFNENFVLFCNLIEAFFSSRKLNFMHDGIILFCLSHRSVCELKVVSMVLKEASVGN